MSDISKLNINGNDYDIKDEAARAAIQNELVGLPVDEKVEIIKNRLNNALADTNAALVAKGATEVTKFDEVPAAIESIQSGGGENDFIGIKYSNYSGDYYNLPKTADARSLDKILKEPSEIASTVADVENGNCLNSAFANKNPNSNGGYFVQLEEVYVPTKAITLVSTFDYCTKLTTIHGDLSNIKQLVCTFRNCVSLDINAVIARMTSLEIIDNISFYGCTQITELTLPATVTSIHSGAFNGCTNVTDVYCPWAEGAVVNAPWGMTNATIHYNYNSEV